MQHEAATDLNVSTASAARPKDVPLVVDLDGTLIRTDLLYESFFDVLTHDLRHASGSALALISGKAALKKHLADRSTLDYATLPYDDEVLEAIKNARSVGRPIYLATASDSQHAKAVSDHLELFDGIIASDGVINLAAAEKAKVLCARFGERGFDYIGSAAADLPVWAKARNAIVVRAPASVLSRLNRVNSNVENLAGGGPSIKVWIKALRVHQYAKNVLVFVPLLTAHLFSTGPLIQSLLAFVSFSACASAAYILNDLFDLKADRGHPTKKKRAFASGEISLKAAMLLAPALLIVAFALALAVSVEFALVLAGYLVLTTLYSLVLKRKMLIDVVALALLYATRVLGGAVAVHVAVSEWLFAFALMIFTSLALVKRYIELLTRLDRGLSDPLNRNYKIGDLEIVAALAAASGMNAVTIFILYVSSGQVATLYSRPQLLWLICPVLLYWISRIVMMAHRRLMDDDPIVFAMRDWNSWVAGILAILIVLAAI